MTAWSRGPFRGFEAHDAMERAAVAIARPFRGRPGGVGYRFDQGDPIGTDRPGVQPPVPPVVAVVTPPRAQLPLEPDLVAYRPVDLPGLDAIDWTRVEAVFDAGADIPDALRRLAALDAAGWQTPTNRRRLWTRLSPC